MKLPLGTFAIALLTVLLTGSTGAQPTQEPAPVATLAPTPHRPLPADLSQMWLVPSAAERPSPAMLDLAAAIKAFDEGRHTDALALLTRLATLEDPLNEWAAYYKAVTLLRLDRPKDADDLLDDLEDRRPAGYLSQAVAFRRAEAAEGRNDWVAAVRLWDQLSQKKTTQPDDVLMRLAKAARAANDHGRAARALARIHYEFPLGEFAEAAAAELESMNAWEPLEPGSARYKLELGRAERLFGARRYAPARAAFESLRKAASGDDRELVALRIAESDHFLKRYRAARDALAPFLENASRRAEALFFYLTATRELGDHETYLRLTRQLVDAYPDSSWAEDALNNLARHYVVEDDDPQADVVFRELLAKFPSGRFAERASWKAGWWSYKNGRFEEAARTFETAAATFLRSDYRPSYLYWSARARDKMGDRRGATDRYTLVTADYLNSYYGRLATDVLRARDRRPASAIVMRVPQPATNGTSESGGELPEAPLFPTAGQVRVLLKAGLIDQAANELLYAQRVWGTSPVIEATSAWIHQQQGDMRRGITLMKRAYPQYLASGGEQLPTEILQVVFPLDYWPLIRKYSAQHNLDPYVIAALIAQESTFTPDAVSVANAVGLMQVLPSTGRRLSRAMKLRFRPSMLTQAEPNIRLGTKYFADLAQRFGGAHYALASYNAGDTRVARWIAERPGLDQDEFIDDIPFPETQNYVKRILGTAEDYRKLYGSGGTSLTAPARAKKPATVTKPAAKKPAAKKPAAKKPAAKKPTVKKPAVKKPTVKKPTVKKPTAKKKASRKR